MLLTTVSAATVAAEVIAVPVRPVMDEARLAQSPEKVPGCAADSCGKPALPPQPLRISVNEPAATLDKRYRFIGWSPTLFLVETILFPMENSEN
jgi:hypothetical protein